MIVDELTKIPDFKVQINGHNNVMEDNVGNENDYYADMDNKRIGAVMKYLIGKGKKYYYGSDNFGETWDKIFVNETLNIRNDVTAVAIDDDGVAHNFGAIPFEIKNKTKYYQSLNSTFTTFFQYENDKFRYKYNPTQSISFSGIPYPGATSK